ncbi:MAG: SRPBCC family protein [Solirubrobacterales bacterium]|nr:SRPBCC family protein [Solirubrobacterales bacterium]
MRTAIETVRRHVVVATGQRRAFEVFTAEMTSWWPPDHHIGAAPIEEIVIEPREGGRWYTRHQDGSETSTGFVSVWEPYERVALAWQIGADWKYDPKLVTTVDLRFVAETPERTRVELEHRDLEAFGPEAERMRAMFEGPGAWNRTLEAFAAVAGRR